MVPGRVVAYIVREHRVHGLQFRVSVEEWVGELSAEPLAVAPDVVILGVKGENVGEEGGLGGREAGHEGQKELAMVP